MIETSWLRHFIILKMKIHLKLQFNQYVNPKLKFGEHLWNNDWKSVKPLQILEKLLEGKNNKKTEPHIICCRPSPPCGLRKKYYRLWIC